MKKRFVPMLSVFAILAVVSPLKAQAEEEAADKPWSIDITTAVYSDYIFRGFNYYDGISIQPEVTVSYDTGFGTFSADGWMHLSGEGDRQEEKFTELDSTFTYAITFDPITVEVGHLSYFYPDSADDINDTSEFYGSIALDDSELSPFSLAPSIAVYRDYRDFDATYYELGLSHETTCSWMGEGFNMTPYVNFGFASGAEKVYEDNGLVQITWGVSSSMPLGRLAVEPSINYTHKIDDLTTNELWFGTSVTLSF